MPTIVLFRNEVSTGKAYMAKRGISDYQIVDPCIEGWSEKIETGDSVFIYPHEILWTSLLEDSILEEEIFIIPSKDILLWLIKNNPSKILKELFEKKDNYLLKRIYDCNVEYSLFLYSILLDYAFKYRNLMILSHFLKDGAQSTDYHYLPPKDRNILLEKYPKSKIRIVSELFEASLSTPLDILHSAIYLQDVNMLKLLTLEDIKDLSGDDEDMNYSPLIAPFGVSYTREFLTELLKLFPYKLTYETTRLYRISIAGAELQEFYPLLLKGSRDPQDLLDLKPKYYDAFSYILPRTPELYLDRILKHDVAWAFLLLPKGDYDIPEESPLIRLLLSE